ncbi:MAG TPA: (5-formylfuran-3-yl)methyl phosphate synthase [Gemmatimonadales bacterium]|nr:(5-formylfuran-3-yl)methyl phosphate synthase [Gemmatimonadales bacterium]
MQLLVSVRGPGEARAALIGGADVIDAKDPRRGPLGAVSPYLLASIRRTVGSSRPVTAALGDAVTERAVAHGARTAARHGVAFVKVGFAGVASEARARRLAAAACRADARVVVVAYADWERVGSLPPQRLVPVAAEVGAAGVLIDTACKPAPLFALASRDVVGAWVAAAHEAGLFAALAGSLTDSDVATARELGADVMGVRGAACTGGRLGRVSPERVATLVALTRATSGVSVGAPPRRPPRAPALLLA